MLLLDFLVFLNPMRDGNWPPACRESIGTLRFSQSYEGWKLRKTSDSASLGSVFLNPMRDGNRAVHEKETQSKEFFSIL